MSIYVNDSIEFLNRLFTNCGAYRDTACITLTTIHPDGKHRTPSRHIPLDKPNLLQDALQRLHATNEMGWGAFIAIALRRKGLGRYRRGSAEDILALPALFVDVDDVSLSALQRLQDIQPHPSCITFTGGGFHAYWILDEPLTDMTLARKLLRALAKATSGDFLSPVQSLRLIGTKNTKPHRKEALCHAIHLQDTTISVSDFAYLLPVQNKSIQGHTRETGRSGNYRFNPGVLQTVTDTFIRLGYKQSGDWLSGACIYPENHLHDDAHPSFGFNTRTGYGNCFRCGSVLLKDISTTLGI